MLINTTGNEHCGRAVNSYSVGTILVANFCRRLEKNIFSHMGPRSEGFFFSIHIKLLTILKAYLVRGRVMTKL